MELVVHPRNVYLDILQDLREESEYFDEGSPEISTATQEKQTTRKMETKTIINASCVELYFLLKDHWSNTC